MGKYKTPICALLITTSIVGYSNIITASHKYLAKEKYDLLVAKLEEEMLISDNALEAQIAFSEAEEIRQAKDKKTEEFRVATQKVVDEKIAVAKKAEEAKLAAEKAEKEKLAAKKAQTAKSTTATKKVSTPVAARSSSRTAASTEKAQSIIEYGKQFMGVKYVFGGASPSGFDCSGFTMYVFKHFGISLPHSAKAQADLGTAVSKNELIPGDLVFFETYKPGISHVGIYIGNGEFLEASSSKGITITKLSSSYYKTRYMGATRILK